MICLTVTDFVLYCGLPVVNIIALNCQNPVTWDINGGLEFDEAAKKEIFDELEKNYVSGITFSGGDPLHTQNRKDVGALIEEIKEKFPN